MIGRIHGNWLCRGFRVGARDEIWARESRVVGGPRRFNCWVIWRTPRRSTVRTIAKSQGRAACDFREWAATELVGGNRALRVASRRFVPWVIRYNTGEWTPQRLSFWRNSPCAAKFEWFGCYKISSGSRRGFGELRNSKQSVAPAALCVVRISSSGSMFSGVAGLLETQALSVAPLSQSAEQAAERRPRAYARARGLLGGWTPIRA
jgi:hypothetical protein